MKKLKIFITLIISIILGIYLNYQWVGFKAKNSIYNEINQTPKNKVGLLRGVSKMHRNGGINLYYKNRLEAAIALFKAGKIEYILVSGDNSIKDYDEPTDFKNDLMARGIPEDKIILDYAGFRTLDSVVRAKEIFGQNNITIISQDFHNERAIYIANHFDIKAIGFNARAVNSKNAILLREYLARTKASLDFMFNVKPKFLGEKIIIQ
jgi:SanA protein